MFLNTKMKEKALKSDQMHIYSFSSLKKFWIQSQSESQPNTAALEELCALRRLTRGNIRKKSARGSWFKTEDWSSTKFKKEVQNKNVNPKYSQL